MTYILQSAKNSNLLKFAQNSPKENIFILDLYYLI